MTTKRLSPTRPTALRTDTVRTYTVRTADVRRVLVVCVSLIAAAGMLAYEQRAEAGADGGGGVGGAGNGAAGAGASGGNAGATTSTSAMTTGPVGSTGSTTSTAAHMQDGGVCESGLTSGTEGTDVCLTGLCCQPFDACTAQSSCQACFVGQGTACDENALYQEWLACSEASCAVDICGTEVAFYSSTGAIEYECNACASQCCSCVETCIGGGSDEELDRCLSCLSDPDGCPDPDIAAWARNFHACNNDNCAGECGATDIRGGDATACTPRASGDGGAGGTGQAPAPAASPPTATTCSCSFPGRPTRDVLGRPTRDVPGDRSRDHGAWMLAAACFAIARYRRRPGSEPSMLARS